MFDLKKTSVVLFFIVIIAAVMLFCKLWDGGLASYDDSFYSAQSRGMIEAGNYLSPYYGGKPIFHNDPFCLWFMVMMFKILGFTEYAARFHSALFGLLTIILIFFLGRLLYNHWTGVFSSFVLMTTLIWMKFARHAMFDITLSFWVTLTIFLFVKSLKQKDKTKAAWFLFFTGLTTGMAMLTKNILGSFPLIAIFIYLLCNKEFKRIFSPAFIFAVITAVVIPGIWVLANYLTFGNEFLRIHYGWIILQRAFQYFKEQQTIWSYTTYVKNLFILYWPWVPFAVLSFLIIVYKNIKNKITPEFILPLWVTVTIVIMSIGHVREFRYILPVFPAFAVMTGAFFNNYILKKENSKLLAVKIGFIILGIIAAIIAFTPVRLDWSRDEDIKEIAPLVKAYIPPDKELIRFHTEDYYTLHQPFMFYTDRNISWIEPKTNKELEAIFSGKDQVFCVTYIDEYNKLDKKYPIIAMSNQMLIIANRFDDSKLYPRTINIGPYKENRR